MAISATTIMPAPRSWMPPPIQWPFGQVRIGSLLDEWNPVALGHRHEGRHAADARPPDEQEHGISPSLVCREIADPWSGRRERLLGRSARRPQPGRDAGDFRGLPRRA